MRKIEVDYAQCERIAAHIAASGGVPKDREDPMAVSFPTMTAENGWWAVVAICHQTTPVEGKPFMGVVGGAVRRGWDYLLQKSIEQANMDPSLFTRQWLERVDDGDLCTLYRDTTHGDTLSHLEQRASLLRGCGGFLARNGWQSIRECYERSDGCLKRDDGLGLMAQLKTVRAFRDPVEKKMSYFLALMRNQGFWQYKDEENLGAPVNYHEQRGHFRLGTVKLLDPELEKNIRARRNITYHEDIEIRCTVRVAVEHIARVLGITPTMAHYFFWNYFRNCCARESAHCLGCGHHCGLPERYRVGDGCRFQGVCASAGLPIADMLIEPRLDDTTWQ